MFVYATRVCLCLGVCARVHVCVYVSSPVRDLTTTDTDKDTIFKLLHPSVVKAVVTVCM